MSNGDLRDRFAMAVIQGMLANEATQGTEDDFAKDAFAYADAMMKARGVEVQNPPDPKTLPAKWYWENDRSARESNSSSGAFVACDEIASHYGGAPVHIPMEVLAALLRVAGYPVGERMKP